MAMRHIQDPSDEEKAKFGLVLIFCKFLEENPVFCNFN